VYYYSSRNYWLLSLPKSNCISVEFQSVRSIYYLRSSLFFFLISVTLPSRTKKVMKDKVKEIDSLSLKIDLLNHTSFSFSFSHSRVIFFFLSSPEASIHLVSAFKQKKNAHGFFAVKYSYFLLKVHTLLFPFSCFPRYFSLLDFLFAILPHTRFSKMDFLGSHSLKFQSFHV